MNKIRVHYRHEPIFDECNSKRDFWVEYPELQDGYFAVGPIWCGVCGVEPQIIEKEQPSATNENLRSKPADRIDSHKLTLTAGEEIPAGALVEVDPGTGMLRNHVVEGAKCACEPKNNHFCYRHRCTPNNCTRSMDEKIEEFRNVRAELSRTLGMDDFARVPVKDGTPLSRKMFVETLCVAQSAIGNSPHHQIRGEAHNARLQVLIDIFSDRGREE